MAIIYCNNKDITDTNRRRQKVKKVLAVLLVMMLGVSGLAGCTKSEDKNGDAEKETTITEAEETETEETAAEEKIDINIAGLRGATSMGMVKMMEDASQGTASNNYQFKVVGTADEISAGLMKGELDIAAVPCNLASVLYNKTEGEIKIAGINTLNVLYIVETGNAINSIEDLRGKTIYSTGKGTTPEYTLNYLLQSNGIDPVADLTVEYKTEATEVASVLSESADAIAVLPQPYVTTVMMSNDNIRIALDIQEEWGKIGDTESGIVTGVVVVRKEFLENNKEAVNAFLDEYKASAAYVNEKAAEAAVLIEKFDIFKAAVAEKAIPLCNITFVGGDEMQEKVNGYLEVLFGQNPNSVGGAVPDDEFYYKKAD